MFIKPIVDKKDARKGDLSCVRASQSRIQMNLLISAHSVFVEK